MTDQPLGHPSSAPGPLAGLRVRLEDGGRGERAVAAGLQPADLVDPLVECRRRLGADPGLSAIKVGFTGRELDLAEPVPAC